MKFSRLIAIACLSLLFAGPTWAQEEKQTEKKEQKEVCPHPEGWAPTKDEMQRILARHSQWLRQWEDYRKGKKDKIGSYELETPPPGEGYRANFCNVDWNNADLRLAELNYAILALAQLN